MLRTPRRSFLVLAGLGAASLPACSARNAAPPAASASAPAAPQGLSVNTPVRVIVADPRGKAVLDRDLPGLTSSASYALFSDMSLSQLAALSNGRISSAKLALVQADLSQLK